jgi:hypothetical protein
MMHGPGSTAISTSTRCGIPRRIEDGYDRDGDACRIYVRDTRAA